MQHRLQRRATDWCPRRCPRLQTQVVKDFLDHRRLQDGCNDLQLAAAIRAVLHRQDVHGFTARPPKSDDPEAAAAEYPLMAEG